MNNGDVFSGNHVLKVDYSGLLNYESVIGIAGMQSFSKEAITDTKIVYDIARLGGTQTVSSILGRNRSGLSFSLRALKFEADKKFLAGPNRFMVDGCYANLKYESGLKAPANSFFYSRSWKKYDSLVNY